MAGAFVRKAGEYTITRDGYQPEAGQAFHYKDNTGEFWFYVEVKTFPNTVHYELSIIYASARQFSGGIPDFTASRVRVIEENIRRYFETFDIIGDPIGPKKPAPPLNFTWKFPQCLL